MSIRSRVTSLPLQLLTLIAGVQEFTDRVVRVIDGDTPILLDAGSTQHKTGRVFVPRNMRLSTQ